MLINQKHYADDSDWRHFIKKMKHKIKKSRTFANKNKEQDMKKSFLLLGTALLLAAMTACEKEQFDKEKYNVYVVDINTGVIPFVNTQLSTDISDLIKKEVGIQ